MLVATLAHVPCALHPGQCRDAGHSYGVFGAAKQMGDHRGLPGDADAGLVPVYLRAQAVHAVKGG